MKVRGRLKRKRQISYTRISNGVITGATNTISSALQGRDWKSTAISGMIGFTSGLIGGIAGNAATKSNYGFQLSKEGLLAQNRVTGALNNFGDRYLWSSDLKLEKGQRWKNGFLGSLEGLMVAQMSADSRFLAIGDNTKINPDWSINAAPGVPQRIVHSTSVLSRYLSPISASIVNSIPGAGFSLFSVYPGVALTMTAGLSTSTIGAGIGYNMGYNALFFNPTEVGPGKGYFGTYPFPPGFTFYGSWNLFTLISEQFE